MRNGQFFQLRPITKRRLQKFRQHRRGWWSLWIFLTLLTLSLFAEFIANNRPLLVFYEGQLYWPVFQSYPETTFGGEFTSEADYQDPYVSALIDKKGKILCHLVRYRCDTIIKDLNETTTSTPILNDLLGTYDYELDKVSH